MNIFAERIRGTVAAPPSKSALHRRLILNRIAGRCDMPENACDDILATATCLSRLGTVLPLNCGDCGATLRFLLPVSLLFGGAVLTGSDALADRPIAPLLQVLREHGALVDRDRLPLRVGGTLKSGTYALDGNISSQFFSALLLTLPFLDGDSALYWTTPLESEGYVRLTERMLFEHDVRVTRIENGYQIPGGQRARIVDAPVEGDWSSSAAMLTLGAIAGSVTVTGLRQDSCQPDRHILEILEQCGAQVDATDTAVTVRRSMLRGFKCNGSIAPDLVPVLAALGCASEGESVLYRLERLRYKESNRFEAICSLLDAVGADYETERSDTIVIHGCGCVRGGRVDVPNDHRMTMAAALLGACAATPIQLTQTDSVRKSYPTFWRDFIALGGTVDAI